MLPSKVEVLVIGAGPAGSTAAEHAALAGADVLLLDKRLVIGEPVRCGEFMPHTDEIRRIFPQAENVEDLLAMPSYLHSLETESIRIYSPKMRSYEIPFHGYTTDRDRFDQYLCQKARKAGAKVLTGVRCFGVKGDVVHTNMGEVRAKVIIGADGPLSVVAKSLGMERSWDLCPAASTFAQGDFDPVPEMFFGNVAPGGYAWIIPKKGGANVGLGYSKRYAKGNLSYYWSEFLRQRPMKIGRLHGKTVPMSGPISQTVKGNALVVGDAAGQVMAVNGGGIPIALICGRIAGKVAAANVKGKMELMEYEKEWRRQVGGPLKTALRTKRLAMLMFGSSWRLEQSMRFLGCKGMGRAIRCQSVPF
ncbi:MAG: NAD(P)/FAD-dependent oxidoreductase [Methanomassiliicoccales archaeon]